MKKFLLSLAAAVISLTGFAQETTYTADISSQSSKLNANNFSGSQVLTIDDIDWTLEITKVNKSYYFGTDNTKGLQIGSAKQAAKTIKLYTSDFADKVIKSVSINASVGGKANVTGTISAGSAKTNITLTTSANTYTATSVANGDIVFDLTNSNTATSGNGAIYIKTITVVYEEGGSSDLNDAELAYSAESYTANLFGINKFPTLDNPNGLDVTYTSSNEAVATVDAEGKVTLVAEGETTITAKSAPTDEFNAGEASYILTVTDSRASAELSFPKEEYSASLGKEFDSPALTNPYNVAVTYASSNEAVATVDENGVVTLVAEGTTVITATSEATNQYKATEAKYILTVTDPNKLDVTFDFAKNDYNYSNGAEVTTVEADPITLTFGAGSNSNAPKWYSTGTAVRVYGGNTMTFKASNKYILKSIEFTTGSANGFNNNTSASNGTFSNNTWTASAEPTTEVTITNGGTSGHARIETITVHYALSSDPDKMDAPEISYNEETETVTITSEIEGASIYYTLDGEEPTAESTLYEGPFTVEKSCTVKAVAVKDGELSNVAIRNVVVPAKAKSIAELLEMAPNINDKAIVGFDMTVVYANGRYVYVIDGNDGSTLLYNLPTDYVAGDVIPAGWEATNNLYNGLVEFTGNPKAATTTAEFTIPTVETVTEADINRVVVISNVIFGETTPTQTTEGKAVNFDGILIDGTTVTFRTQFSGIESVEAGEYNVTAAVGIYSKTLQVYPISYEKIELEKVEVPFIIGGPKTEYTDGEEIRLSTGNSGATIYFTLDGSNVEIPGWGEVESMPATPAAAPRKVKSALAAATDYYNMTGTNVYEPEHPIVFQKGQTLDLNYVAYKEGMAPSEPQRLVVNGNGETTGIENVAVDADASAEVEYFNLQGVRVENPSAGIFIRRQGRTVSKVVVK